MLGIFKRFKQGLQKTSRKLFGSLGGIFDRRKLDAQSLEELEAALYEADFGVETTEEIIEAAKAAYKEDKDLSGSSIREIAFRVLSHALEGAEGHVQAGTAKPQVICLLGINGAGKTTTAGKLASRFKQEGQSVLLGACDTFRAAANEQIKLWAQREDIELVASHHGADSAAVAFDAYEGAKARNKDLLILDTAGRLHNRENLMKELAKLKRVLQKHSPDAPEHSWLVVDGSLGANSIEQARAFHKHFGLTGLVITKLDGSSRGGAIVGIYRELKLPIYFVGLGEKAEDLQPFSIENYLNALLGKADESNEHTH